jgi:hypothetical protein
MTNGIIKIYEVFQQACLELVLITGIQTNYQNQD